MLNNTDPSLGLAGVDTLKRVVHSTIKDIEQACEARRAHQKNGAPRPLVQDAVRIAQEYAIDNGIPTALFAPFSSQRAVGVRILAIRTGIAVERLLAGDLESKDWPVLTRSAAQLQKAPLFIDASQQFFDDMRNKILFMKERHGVRVAVIDIDNMWLNTDKIAKRTFADLGKTFKVTGVKVIIIGGRF